MSAIETGRLRRRPRRSALALDVAASEWVAKGESKAVRYDLEGEGRKGLPAET